MGERKNLVEVSFKLSLEEHYDLLKEIIAVDKNVELNKEKVFNWAVENNNTKLVSLLIQITDVTEDDNYAIKVAAKEGYAEIVKQLIDAGADLTANDNYAIKHAAENGHTEVVKLLIDAGADVTADCNWAIRYATENGHTEVVKMLIDAGTDVTAWGNDAIIRATINGHAEIVKLLIDAGANVTANTIRYAEAYGHTEVAKMLIEARSDADDYSIKSVFLDHISSQIRKLKNFLKNL